MMYTVALFRPRVTWRVQVSLGIFYLLLPSFAMFCCVLPSGAKNDMISCAIRCTDVLGFVMLPCVVLFSALLCRLAQG